MMRMMKMRKLFIAILCAVTQWTWADVTYIECAWDDANQTVTQQSRTLTREIGYNDVPGAGDYKEVNHVSEWYQLGGYTDEVPEFYVVHGDVSNQTMNVLGKNVHLILCDNAKLTLSGGILCTGEHKLYIHSQSYDTEMGKLKAQSGYGDEVAGIGSDKDHIPGDIEIHGGDIYAKGSEKAAGIGGGGFTDGGNLIIYGGKVEARGGDETFWHYGGTGIGGGTAGNGGHIIIYDGEIYAYGGAGGAGIGSGYIQSVNESYVEIYGGRVEARGGKNAAGIGGGNSAIGIDLTIFGGEIYAYGGDDAAGIGGGWTKSGGNTTIHGGYVYAKGDGNGAGIGSGSKEAYEGGIVTGGTTIITGGEVYAYGGVDAAGIGGGEDADGGTISISGGSVYAEGNDYGAGIGGGQDGKGADVTITGGTVVAKAGRNETGMRAIGPGKGSNDYGTLTLGDDVMVSSERKATTPERKNMCWYRTQVRVEPCDHSDVIYTVDGTGPTDHHIAHCIYCNHTDTAQHTFVNGVCTVCGVQASSYDITLYEEGFNEATLSLYNGLIASKVTLSGRTFVKNGDWTTLCLPFSLSAAELAVSPLAGCELKQLDPSSRYDAEHDKLYVNFIDATTIEAGKPYMIRWTEGETVIDPVFLNVTIDADTEEACGEKLTFTSTYSKKSYEESKTDIWYITPGGALVHPDGTNDAVIGACRAYFRIIKE